MIRRCRILTYFLSLVLAVTTLYGCTVNVNTFPGKTETGEAKEEITRGIPGEDEEEEGEEDQAVSEEILESRNVMAIQAPGYTGLTNLKQEDNEDGTYFYEDMTEDGVTIITNMSAPNSQKDGQDPDAYAENFVCAMVDNDAEITGSKEDKDLTEKFTYPVYKVDWESGNNEDTRQAVGIVVLTDNFTFYFGYKCPIDDYEDNQEFYEDELKNLEFLDFSVLFTQEDEDASKSGEEEEIEIPSEDIEDMLAGIEAGSQDGEKKNDPEMDRAMDDVEVSYTMDDVAGYWKYEDYDEIYLALYDSGQFETYDMESDEVVSGGSYEVEDNEIVIVEDDKEPQIMQVISMVRLADDEGDILVRFNPDGGVIIAENGEEDEESAENRLYGIHTKDDVVTEDAGKGFKRIKSRSRQVSLSYPYRYYSGVCFDDTLYIYDGDVAYVTARNLTGEFTHWKGSVKSFKQCVGDTFIPKDFTYFYGKRTGIANVKREYSTKGNSVCRTYCNMWNNKNDIQCNSNLFLQTLKDGSQQLVLLNLYYRWNDNNSYNHISRVSIGAVKNY